MKLKLMFKKSRAMASSTNLFLSTTNLFWVMVMFGFICLVLFGSDLIIFDKQILPILNFHPVGNLGSAISGFLFVSWVLLSLYISYKIAIRKFKHSITLLHEHCDPEPSIIMLQKNIKRCSVIS